MKANTTFIVQTIVVGIAVTVVVVICSCFMVTHTKHTDDETTYQRNTKYGLENVMSSYISFIHCAVRK